uniref:16S rRNA (uracil(1498)-N(3))-methyltransferase n=1 Tax=Attheya septentrionalis TaxID=420275 RepID=A0A7S2UFY5_9STRA|mmetsp:Transcript_23874/g.43167  ORF Transcript_23874/g.43167 Transcript_23874/m.43167 type:complete len:476 (+) Transcript_23874:39-1466(+)
MAGKTRPWLCAVISGGLLAYRGAICLLGFATLAGSTVGTTAFPSKVFFRTPKNRESQHLCGSACGLFSLRRQRQSEIETLLTAPTRLETKLNAISDNGNFGKDHDVKGYTKLPRLYVGEFPPVDYARASALLAQNRRVSLTPDQSHYLLNVMRIFGKSGGRKKVSETRLRSEDGVEYDPRLCVRIFDGQNGEWLAQILELHDDETDASNEGTQKQRARRKKISRQVTLYAQCLFQLRKQDQNELTPSENTANETRNRSPIKRSIQPYLFFAPIKKARTKLMIEKSTELGAGKFIPILTDRCDTGALGIEFDKLALQALEAAEQSEKLVVPSVLPNLDCAAYNHDSEHEDCVIWNTESLLEFWSRKSDEGGLSDSIPEGSILMICRERSKENSAKNILQALQIYSREDELGTPHVSFLIGPEGGWSPEEESLFDRYCGEAPRSNVCSISLGPSVLRAETAAMMAVGAWSLYTANLS